MQAADIVVLSSHGEGLPFVLVEAQASGLPCIVSDTISLNTDLIGNIRFLSLTDANKWKNAFLVTPSVDRSVVQNSPLLQSFDIRTTVKTLEAIYLRN